MRFTTVKNFFLILSLVLLAGLAGYKLGTNQVRISQTNFLPKIEVVNKLPTQTPPSDFSLFWKVWEDLAQKYVDKTKLDSQKMVYGAIAGMVASLGDPYTMFLPPTQNKESKEDLNGKFEGIGASLELKNGQVIVTAPLSGSPAEKAGIKAQDAIIKVNGQETKNWSLADTVAKIRGPKRTKVTLTIVHANDPRKPLDLTIVRDTIILKSVEWKVLENKIIYLKLARFGDETQRQWDETIEEIKNKKEENTITGVILDLRNNPGGLLSQAVYIASEFLPVDSGVVVKQVDNQNNTATYSVSRQGKLLKIPLVILVNQGTASASEILAGALQVAGRGKIVGETTFGKGSVQETQDFAGGAGLHVTVAKWLLRNDVWINGAGLTPDVKIDSNSSTDSADLQLNGAIKLLR
jgi:carboxyl-terminal processing protease